MSKVAFLLYYGGFCGLMAAYTVNDIWLDRTALVSLVLGCWLHAQWWKRHIESVTTPVQTLVAALDLLNAQRKEMDVFVRWMPRLFSSRERAEKNEYLFIRLADKSLSQAIRSLVNNNWEVIPIFLCFAIPIALFGIGAFEGRLLKLSPIFHDFMVHLSVLIFTPLMSIGITLYFVFCFLRK